MKQILIIAVLVLLISCAPAPPAEEPALQQKPEPEPVIEPEPEPKEDNLAEELAEEQEKKIIKEISKVPKLPPRDRETAVEQFWAMYAQNVTGYHFKFAGRGIYSVRENKVRYLPFNAIRIPRYEEENGSITRQVYLDAVYLDLTEKTAIGYCEGLWDENVNEVCAESEFYDRPFKVDFETFIVKLPHEWLLEYQDKSPIIEEQEKYYVKSRQTTKIAFSDGVQFFVDPRAGLPVQVIVTKLNKQIFDDLVVNQVREVEVKHRPRSEIPQDEMFYKPIY
jgi:hypothetical protein